jgi:hypothetical protein
VKPLGAALVLLVVLGACGGSHGPASALLIAGGNEQSGVAGKELPLPVKVKVVDDKGRAVPSQPVNFRVTGGGGSVFASAVTSNSDGIAQERWTIGTAVGIAQTLEARALDSVAGAELATMFTATVLPDVPASIRIVAGNDQAAIHGSTLSQLNALVVDQYGNPVPSFAVSWTADSGGSIDAPLLTDASGMATASWTLGAARGSQTARVTAGSASTEFHAFSRVFTVLATGLQNPFNLVVDEVRAYWTEGFPSALRSLALANPSPQTLVADAGVAKLVVDDGGVYWSNNTGIHMLDESHLTDPPTDLLAWSQVDAGTPLHVFALGSERGYFVARVGFSNDVLLEAFPRGGLTGSPELIGEVATPCPDHGSPPTELVANDRAAYFTVHYDLSHCDHAYAVALDGGAGVPLSSEVTTNLVLDSDYLYGTSPSGSNVHAVPVTASPSHPPPPIGVSVSGYGGVYSYAVDSTSIYWHQLGAVLATNFLDGGTHAIDRGDTDQLFQIAVNRNSVFWFFGGQLREGAK